nr:hypothetical protein [Tanacetum cinerariifolium]
MAADRNPTQTDPCCCRRCPNEHPPFFILPTTKQTSPIFYKSERKKKRIMVVVMRRLWCSLEVVLAVGWQRWLPGSSGCLAAASVVSGDSCGEGGVGVSGRGGSRGVGVGGGGA